jgi:ketosteroid isomerase-like protein
MSSSTIILEALRCSDRGDFDSFRALFAKNCEWRNPVVTAHGAEEISRAVAGLSAPFPQRQHRVALTIESGDLVAVEGHWTATHESGRSVDVPFAAMVDVHGGLIASVRLYLDTAAMAAQLSAEPVPA